MTELEGYGWVTFTNYHGRKIHVRREDVAMVTASDTDNDTCWLTMKGDIKGLQVLEQELEVMQKLTGNPNLAL